MGLERKGKGWEGRGRRERKGEGGEREGEGERLRNKGLVNCDSNMTGKPALTLKSFMGVICRSNW